MAIKRANGEGSIGKYKNGWRSRIMIGYNSDGKPIRKEFYGKTQKEAKEKLEEFKKQYFVLSNKSLVKFFNKNNKLLFSKYIYNKDFKDLLHTHDSSSPEQPLIKIKL